MNFVNKQRQTGILFIKKSSCGPVMLSHKQRYTVVSAHLGEQIDYQIADPIIGANLILTSYIMHILGWWQCF